MLPSAGRWRARLNSPAVEPFHPAMHAERMRELTAANVELERRADLLEDAERVAHIGSWEWVIATGRTRWSDETFRLFGRTPGDVEPSFETFMAHISPAERDKVALHIQKCMETATGETLELSIHRPDGVVRQVSFRTDVITDAHEKPVRLVGVVQDITERSQMLAAVRRSEERFQTVARATEDIIWDWDFASDTVVWVNDSLIRQFGYEGTQGPLDWWLSLIHPDDLAAVDKSIHEVVASGQSLWSSEYRFRHSNGTYADIFDRGIVMRDGAGRPTRMLGAMQDITSRKTAERKQAALVKELEAVNRELGEFAYVVSHDLKAPLRGIGSLADWIARDQRERLDDDGKEQIDLLLGRVKRMDELIEGILRYSRIGRAKDELVTLDTGVIVSDVVDLVAAPERVKVIVDGPMPTLRAARTQITQVFQNLIGNAVKFCDKPAGEVRVSCAEEASHYRFEIRDNGPGIDARHHERIFQIFQTLAPRDKSQNTGIGLSIVKKIVETAGGRIWVESAVGKGSTFFFTLPKPSETP
jgi:PAS domain S-box-containing protein